MFSPLQQKNTKFPKTPFPHLPKIKEESPEQVAPSILDHPYYQKIEKLETKALYEQLAKINRKITKLENQLLSLSDMHQKKQKVLQTKSGLILNPAYLQVLQTMGPLKAYKEVLVHEAHRRNNPNHLEPDSLSEALADITLEEQTLRSAPKTATSSKLSQYSYLLHTRSMPIATRQGTRIEAQSKKSNQRDRDYQSKQAKN
jgi:hypothetical protein